MSEFTLIEAAGHKPKVAGIAYSGGRMNLPGWKHPVVVDLSGMEIPESVPLLTNHENKTDARVGMISAGVKNNRLEIAGEIVSDGKEAQDIVAQGKAGAAEKDTISSSAGVAPSLTATVLVNVLLARLASSVIVLAPSATAVSVRSPAASVRFSNFKTAR